MSAMPTDNQFPLSLNSPLLGRWNKTHDYDVWTECKPAEAAALRLWEVRGAGVVRIPDNASVLHVIKGGTAHHVEGVFGYWRTCDSDIIWVRVEREGVTRYAMIVGGSPSDYHKDVISWICPRCATSLHSVELQTGRAKLNEFWAREAEIVAAFNADEALRTCTNCAHVHPLAYSFRSDRAAAPDPDLAW
jgi:hypothetical protein